MNKYLIFRTDRIGDLLITCPLMATIKKHLTNSRITLITSVKNYEYAQSFDIFDKIYIYPEKNLLDKIKFILKLSKIKFDYTLILDGKERSLISSIFVKSVYKVAVITEKKLNLFFKFFKIDYIIDYDTKDLINVYQKSLSKCGISLNIDNFDFIENKKDNNFSSFMKIKNFIHIHLNEKWFSKIYIKKYSDINPNYDDFVDFINILSKKGDVLISTGLIDFDLLNLLKKKFFTKHSEKIYYKKTANSIIYLIYKPTLSDLESLFRKSKILILCHSGIIHAANSFNIKIIDILDENHYDWYRRWISYLKNYNFFYRAKFVDLKTKIVNHIATLD